MIITVDTTNPSPRVSLDDPENFGAFSIAATGTREAFGKAVAGIGRYDGDHVFVRPDALRALAGALAQDDTWSSKLDGMMNYAEQHGWVDGDGAIRAHIDWR
jgi:hypothetical protein